MTQKNSEKAERLAAALRANLRKRKEYRGEDAPAPSGGEARSE